MEEETLKNIRDQAKQESSKSRSVKNSQTDPVLQKTESNTKGNNLVQKMVKWKTKEECTKTNDKEKDVEVEQSYQK